MKVIATLAALVVAATLAVGQTSTVAPAATTTTTTSTGTTQRPAHQGRPHPAAVTNVIFEGLKLTPPWYLVDYTKLIYKSPEGTVNCAVVTASKDGSRGGGYGTWTVTLAKQSTLSEKTYDNFADAKTAVDVACGVFAPAAQAAAQASKTASPTTTVTQTTNGANSPIINGSNVTTPATTAKQ